MDPDIMDTSPLASPTTSQPHSIANSSVGYVGEWLGRSISAEEDESSRALFIRNSREKPPRSENKSSGLRLRDGPPGHDLDAEELKNIKFMTPMGNLVLPTLGMPPYKPTEDMIQGAHQGVSRGFFRESYILPAKMLGELVDSTTGTIVLDDKYEFVPDALENQDNLRAEDKSISRLYFISILPGELPSFYFWQPKDMPLSALRIPPLLDSLSPLLLEDEIKQIGPQQDTDTDMRSPDSSSGLKDDSLSEDNPMNGNSEDESSSDTRSTDLGEFDSNSDGEQLNLRPRSPSWMNQPTRNLQEMMENKRPLGTFALNSHGFPPKLVHARKGGIQIREFKNFAVWEATILKLLGEQSIPPAPNFLGCFKRLYQITNAQWSVRVHPNDDCWVRDEWEFIGPHIPIDQRQDHFENCLRSRFRQFQNVIVSMCPKNIEVHNGGAPTRHTETWNYHWDETPAGGRIEHSAGDLALICERLLGINPQTDTPGVFIQVTRWKADGELLHWSPNMSEYERI